MVQINLSSGNMHALLRILILIAEVYGFMFSLC